MPKYRISGWMSGRIDFSVEVEASSLNDAIDNSRQQVLNVTNVNGPITEMDIDEGDEDSFEVQDEEGNWNEIELEDQEPYEDNKEQHEQQEMDI